MVAVKWFARAAFTLMVLAANASAETLTGRVVTITDAGTLILVTDGARHEVRLSGIAIPESDQPYGAEARQRLSEVVLDKEVRVEHRMIDEFGRAIGRVWVQPVGCPGCRMTLDVSLALLTTGMAWWYQDPGNEQTEEERGQYEFAELEARSKQAGLWHDRNPIPPWEWRDQEAQP